eukprot:scaffold10649_cov84-Isochrysis_galbana.AAC.2
MGGPVPTPRLGEQGAQAKARKPTCLAVRLPLVEQATSRAVGGGRGAAPSVATCNCAARVVAALATGTLNPKTAAPTLLASCTSDSVMGPTAALTILSSTREVGKWLSPAATASSEPAESALRSAGTSLLVRRRCPRRGATDARASTSALSCRNSLTSLARASEGTTSISSPAAGRSRSPLIRAGVDGPASSSGRPSSSCSSRTRPHVLPTTT